MMHLHCRCCSYGHTEGPVAVTADSVQTMKSAEYKAFAQLVKSNIAIDC